jgi:glycosyltransferase involved in cell wall biosynthesis
MKIGLITRRGAETLWAGDLKALQVIQEGMQQCGASADLVFDFSDIGMYDFLFLSNTCFDLRPNYHALKLHNKPFGLIAFHEDVEKYKPVQVGFFRYVQGCLKGEYQVESLWENPEIFFPLKTKLTFDPLMNGQVLKESEICIGSSPTEVRTLQRDCPGCKAKSVLFTSGFAEGEVLPNKSFLEFSQQTSKGYILQVGRFDERKNQLATILATKDSAIPLVFIATLTTHLDYEEACLRAIAKYRKAPTLIVSQMIPSMQSGNLRILQMPGGKILSSEMLLSAFFHAALHLHPAFYELPGYTYLESARLGVPTIASSWATVNEYFTDDQGVYTLDSRIEYALPYDLPCLEKLLHKKIRERYSPYPYHPAFHRKSFDVAREILESF